MSWKKTTFSFLDNKPNPRLKARKGISLHAHTQHSQEMLDFIPHYAEKIPIVSYFWEKERVKFREGRGRDIDFSDAYWSPPMTPELVYASECDRIESVGLDPLVSITDHDSIAGALDAAAGSNGKSVPISLEWTVPFDIGFFHVGVHNLPRESAQEITDTLLAYTFADGSAGPDDLIDILTMLQRTAGVLVVLNHPLWDIELAGQQRHELLLAAFLDQYGHRIHALEINGFRSWSENKAVIELARSMDIPVVTGGDRHGCQPNTMINLSEAETFDEFAEDIRNGICSHLAVFPEYRQPLLSRQLASASEILGEYTEFPVSRMRWFDRIFFDLCDGRGVRALSELGWVRGPLWLRLTIRTFRLLGKPATRPLFRLLEDGSNRVPQSFALATGTMPRPEKQSPKLSSV